MGTNAIAALAHHAHTTETAHGETVIVALAVCLAVARLVILAREALRGVRS